MPTNETPFIEAFTQGDGHDHECACTGTVGESDSLIVADGQAYHLACWEAGVTA